mgnify:CR=1 FL=1|jgi:hypothetical protein
MKPHCVTLGTLYPLSLCVQVLGNQNRIPYYSARLDDPAYLSSMHGDHQGYGHADQTEIFGGSGIHVSQNAESYSHGWFEISENVCYGNGVDGIAVYATARVAVHSNVMHARLEPPHRSMCPVA